MDWSPILQSAVKKVEGRKALDLNVMVETMGLEPTASGLQSPRSPS